MASFKTKWKAARNVLLAAKTLGGEISGMDTPEQACEHATMLFEVFCVPVDSVLWMPTSREGLCICLHNAASGPGVTGLVLEEGPRVLTFMHSMALTEIDFRSLHACKRMVETDETVPKITGERVMCTWKHSRNVMLALYVEGGFVQLEAGGDIRPISETCTRAFRLRQRDQAFDDLWKRGRTNFTGYMAALGSLGRLQRKINGQRNVKGVVTTASPELGPAAIIYPETADKASDGQEIGLSVEVEKELTDYEQFMRADMGWSENEIRGALEQARRNVRAGRRWNDDGE